MTTWQIDFTANARQDLKDVPANMRPRLLATIQALANDPYPTRAKQLREPLSPYYRVPVADWRIIYKVEEDIKLVMIHWIRRKTGTETYEDLVE